MVKKKVTGLSTLFLVLLLGLSTSCYADSENFWTLNQLKNVYYNYMTLVNESESYKTQFLNYHEQEFQQLVNKLNENNYVYIMFQEGTVGYNSFIGYGNTDSIWYNYRGSLSMTSSSGYKYYVMPYTLTKGWENNGYFSGTEFTRNIYYFSKNIYTNSSGTTINVAKGYKPSYLLTSPFIDNKFEFTYTIDTGVLVDNVSPLGIYPAFINIRSGDTIVGYIEKAENLKTIIKYDYYYDIFQQNFIQYRAEVIADNIDVTTDRYSLLFKPIKANTLVSIEFIPKNDSGFESQYAEIYVTDNNTIINNGIANLTDTFSGDYYNYYINNINNTIDNYKGDDRTEEIINTITDDSKVDNMLADFGSGDIALKFGFIENELNGFTGNNNPTFIISNLINGFCDIIMQDNNPYFDYSMHGEPPTRIYARDFTTKETALKVFVRLSLIFGVLFSLYYQLQQIIEAINTANAPKVIELNDATGYFYKM